MTQLDKTGTVRLEEDVLVFRNSTGQRVLQMYVTHFGPVFEMDQGGEPTLFSVGDDPGKLRFLIKLKPGANTDSGGISWNVLRAGDDRVQEEVAYEMGGIAEDALAPGDYRGQIVRHIRTDYTREPTPVQVWSTAYSEERAWADVPIGVRTAYTAVKYLLTNLWKFNVVEDPSAPPPTTQPPLPQPPPISGPHGIPIGDFAALEAFYGFPSDDRPPYLSGSMTWDQVIARMDRRT
jgi:hypothetical protein